MHGQHRADLVGEALLLVVVSARFGELLVPLEQLLDFLVIVHQQCNRISRRFVCGGCLGLLGHENPLSRRKFVA
jgi:hypothetical protein